MKNVARGNVLFGGAHHVFIRALRMIRLDLGWHSRNFFGGRQGLFNVRGDRIQFLIRGFGITVQDIGDEEDAATRMVKGDDGICQQVHAIGDGSPLHFGL